MHQSLQSRGAPFFVFLLVGLAGSSCSSEGTEAAGDGGTGGAGSGSGAVSGDGGQGPGDGGSSGSGGAASGGEAAAGGGGSGGDATGGLNGVGGAESPSGGSSTGGGAGTGGDGSGGEGSVVDFRSPGCAGSGPILTEGVHTFDLDGRNRRYTVRLPENYDASRAWPLVLALHPNGGDVGYWDGTSGSRNIRGHLRQEAVIVIAEAIGGNWRDYDLPEAQWPDRVDQELSYFDRVLEDAKGQLCLDERSIFAMGFSGGGSFSGVLGCMRTDIRAFAAGGSVIYFDPSLCVGSAAAWITLSEGDYTEDRGAYLDFFVDRASCQNADMRQQGCHPFEGCDPESPVVFCYYPGGHDWPGFGVEESWDFFTQFIEP